MKDSRSAVETIKNVLNEELKILQSCEDGRSFLYNSKKLIGKIRSHPMLKGFISELEAKNMECREKDLLKTFQVTEQEFLFRYKLPSSTFAYKKSLLKQKYIFNKSRESSSYSPIAEVSRIFQNLGFPASTSAKTIQLSPLYQFKKDFPSLGINGYLKSNVVQAYLEVDTAFLWNQLQILEEALNLMGSSCTMEEYFLKKTPLKGRWEKVGFINWKYAYEASHRINISLAYFSLKVGVIDNRSKIETSECYPFAPEQYILTRKEITKYFERLFHLINVDLLEKLEQFEEENETPLTKREQYKKKAVKMLRELFMQHPDFTIGQIVSEYKKNEDTSIYEEKTLRDIIRTNSLDKRTHKPRGADKKPRQTKYSSNTKRVTTKK